jgi:hypothetical protein
MVDAQSPEPAQAPGTLAANARIPTPVAVATAAAMTLLAILGTAITMADVAWAGRYWLFLVPVYGLLCIVAAWYRRGMEGDTVGLQLLHWTAVAAAIAIDFGFLQGRAQQTSAATGLSSLLILALGCLIAGIHLEWLFVLVGVLLLAIVIVIAMAQEYLMLILLIGALTLAVVLLAPRLLRRWTA